jgi:phosphomannomutase
MDLPALQAAAREWVADDPDPRTRAEVDALLAAGDAAALADRFGAPLTFGTAGIRGAVGAGPARMNRAVVRRITAGLAARLLEEPGAAEAGVVVGRDARHGSDAFAADAAAVLAGAGIRVHRFPDVVPTPLVAFAVRHLDAAAGVVVTASHNPPADNGYKVYWRGGAQIVSPLDDEIAAAAAAVPAVRTLPMGAAGGTAEGAIQDLGDDVLAAYLAAALALVRAPEHRDLRIAYTPLHGVARDTLLTLLAHAGFTDVHVVPEQAEPDPDFPTVTFPNPEEPGALDRALALADAVGADLVLANDPDGDRIAAAIRVPDGHGADPAAGSGWRALTGDEIGCLLAEAILAAGSGPRTVATTVVSSQLLARIAAAHDVAYAETLTGFKWLATAAVAADEADRPLVLAYEQALGVMCGTAVRDKDGLSAALLMAELAAVRKAAGSSVVAALDELAVAHGLHLTTGRSARLEGAEGQSAITAALAALRADPPTEVDGVPVLAFDDRAAGSRRAADGTVTRLDTPPQDLLGLQLADGSRVQVRPSGTEPLLKCYIEVVEPVVGGDVDAARASGTARLDRLADAFAALALPR